MFSCGSLLVFSRPTSPSLGAVRSGIGLELGALNCSRTSKAACAGIGLYSAQKLFSVFLLSSVLIKLQVTEIYDHSNFTPDIMQNHVPGELIY